MRRLFGFGVQLAADQHERGRKGGFEYAEENARDEEGSVAVACGRVGGGDAPKDEVG